MNGQQDNIIGHYIFLANCQLSDGLDDHTGDLPAMRKVMYHLTIKVQFPVTVREVNDQLIALFQLVCTFVA